MTSKAVQHSRTVGERKGFSRAKKLLDRRQ
jgi:hypothetical protein